MKKEEQMAYAAGCMEGDGSFFISKRKSPNCIRYVAGANIGKSSKELIAFFVNLFGGNISYRGEHARWQVASEVRTKPFLESILPYLKMKKDRALFLLDWFKSGMDNKEESYENMKTLNKKICKELSVEESIFSEGTSIDWAYIAGLMDTDGSFMITKRVKGTKNPWHTAKVSYGEIDSRPCSFIKKCFKYGKIVKKENGNTNEGRFVWELVVKDQICSFIRKIIPYLLVKKRNAEIVLKFCENMNPMTEGHRFGIPKEELEFRESCFQELKPLQRR
jgi:hypothetical protein